MVFNDTRVIPARVFGAKESGGSVEILLERALTAEHRAGASQASKGLRPGCGREAARRRTARACSGGRAICSICSSPAMCVPFFEAHGEMPLPPYIGRTAESADRERYQTVYARDSGRGRGAHGGTAFRCGYFRRARGAAALRHAFVTLHVGAGTFQPVRVDDIERHQMHAEYLEVPEATCDAINATRAAGGRVIAVGTTVVRSLETAAGAGAAEAGAAGAGAAGAVTNGGIAPYRGATRIFIKPGYRFRAVDAMITNFHLPESTLLMLCAAFVGRESAAGRLCARGARALPVFQLR